MLASMTVYVGIAFLVFFLYLNTDKKADGKNCIGYPQK